MDKVSELTARVLGFLNASRDTPDHDRLLGIVATIARALAMSEASEYTEQEIYAATREVETIRPTTMSLGSMCSDQGYRPWLHDKLEQIDFQCWIRYRNLLKERFSPDVVDATDNITSRILDHLEDPEKEGPWAKRGLVVGHVQSGKTANFIGLISKAADAGYKVIVVLGGMLNSLRNQTQTRIDSDFVGRCSKTRQPIGVARFTTNSTNQRFPVSFTSADKDFTKDFAYQAAVGLGQMNVPIVFVIKKNVTTLNNIREWLDENNRHNLRDYPLLLIDDEADNASVNTRDKDKDPTAINNGIRLLLSRFPRSSFVGYTATPFANIFIDPDETEDMLGDDLFPRDFILSLDPPSNYFGAEEVFEGVGESGNVASPYVVHIGDNEDCLPVKHKRDFEPSQLPESLKDAVDCFLLAKTIRLIRGQRGKHHSMMINTSRFTAVQNRIKQLVATYVNERKEAITNYSSLPEEEALSCNAISQLKVVYERYFSEAGTHWCSVQYLLNEAAADISTICVNVLSNDSLDYDTLDWPDGRSLIVVGGMALSRGLTLEGLSVSYILRNSTAYDTILQMGRWFGYRDGYKDLCRIFITSRAASEYAHISEAVEELRDDLRQMYSLGLTPKTFGLRVRRHPTALEITARNKMRTAETVTREVALSGRFVETYKVFNNDLAIAQNIAAFRKAVDDASRSGTCADSLPEGYTQTTSLGWFWKDASADIVKDLVKDFINVQECFQTDKAPLLNFLREYFQNEPDRKVDVLLRSRNKDESLPDLDINGHQVFSIERTIVEDDVDGEYVTFTKHHITGKGDERAGIPDEAIKRIKDTYPGGDVPDKEYRKYKGDNRMNPLLILIVASVAGIKNKARRRLVPAYGISFPGDSGNCRLVQKTVSYSVALTYQRQMAALLEGSDDGDEEVDIS